jgi:hypothetical protein
MGVGKKHVEMGVEGVGGLQIEEGTHARGSELRI